MTDDNGAGAMTDRNQPRAKGRWVRIALVASLCLNVLVIGAAGGFLLRHEDRGGRDRGGIERIVRMLPDDRRKAARAILEAQRPEYDALRDQIREARRESIALMTAEPFDEAALRASVEKARALSARRRAIVEDAMTTFISQLTPEERRTVARGVADRRQRWERWRKDRSGE